MNKQNTIYIIISIFFIITGCSYQSIYSENKNIFFVKNIGIEGDKRIGYILKNQILLSSSEASKNKISIDLNIEKNKNSKVKDISGKITRYEIDLNVTMIIKDDAGNQVLEKKFQKTNDYDVRKNHSETIIKEKETAKTLGDQIAEDVIFFLNLFYKEK
jgi:hypothetical protein|tara:strand:- start:61 stop:537 length:477 start_codon:yes stop_codon:yes gene_type:complete